MPLRPALSGDRRGAAAVEYVLITALVAMGFMYAIVHVGTSMFYEYQTSRDILIMTGP